MIQKNMLNSKIFLQNVLTSDDVCKSIVDNLDELIKIIPELNDMIDFEHKNPEHHLNVFDHTLFALFLSDNDFEIRLALLLHDIGKPHKYFEKDNIRHFTGHPLVSKEISYDILKKLNYSDKFIEEICYLVENHDNIITTSDIKANYDLSYKRYLIQVCDALAHNPKKIEKRIKYLEKTKNKLKEYSHL